LEDLQFLAPLPNHCAARIAKVYALLDRVRSWVLCCDHADVRLKAHLFDLALKNADEWLALCDRAESRLKAALQECKAAAQLDVPDTRDRPQAASRAFRILNSRPDGNTGSARRRAELPIGDSPVIQEGLITGEHVFTPPLSPACCSQSAVANSLRPVWDR
jgi:hypothetical protein